MKLIDGKPLIKNATEPEDLFTDHEMELIKGALSRMYVREKYGKNEKAGESEAIKVGRLLEKARFNGYYPRGVAEDGNIRWFCLAQPRSKNIYNSEIEIRACEECGKYFQSRYFLGEGPNKLCRACQLKVKKAG